MRKTILLTLTIAGVFIIGNLASNEAFAAVNVFMKIEGVDGEATDKDHKDWINLESIQWSASRPASSTGGGSTGPATAAEMSITNVLDSSSPQILRMMVTGEHLRVKIDVCRTTDKGCYLSYELRNAMISNYSVGGSGGEDRLTENVTLNFEEIKVTYQKFDKGKPTGAPIQFSWDLREGTAS